jgi:hypothetical protein
MEIREAAASFLLFLFVISRKNSKFFCYSIKRAYFNKPFPMT